MYQNTERRRKKVYDLENWAAVQRGYKKTQSKRYAARILKMSRNTVRKLLEEKEAPTYHRTIYQSKIDEYKEQIIKWRCEPYFLMVPAYSVFLAWLLLFFKRCHITITWVRTHMVIPYVCILLDGFIPNFIIYKFVLSHEFCFKCPIITFHWGIIIRTAWFAHALDNPVFFTKFSKCLGCILGTLVTVEDQSLFYGIIF